MGYTSYKLKELEMSSKTAIPRKKHSLPLKIALSKGLIKGRILDYGCGRGTDIKYLKNLGYNAVGYDPNYFPNKSILTSNTYDTVLCFYVLNVVFPQTREEILKDIRRVLKPNGIAIIAVRDITEEVKGKPYLDGVITAKGTFQKLFSPEELKSLISKYFKEVKIISRSRPLMIIARK